MLRLVSFQPFSAAETYQAKPIGGKVQPPSFGSPPRFGHPRARIRLCLLQQFLGAVIERWIEFDLWIFLSAGDSPNRNEHRSASMKTPSGVCSAIKEGKHSMEQTAACCSIPLTPVALHVSQGSSTMRWRLQCWAQGPALPTAAAELWRRWRRAAWPRTMPCPWCVPQAAAPAPTLCCPT